MIEALTWVALGLVAVIATESWIFVARHARVQWWASGEGRYLMRSKIALALLFTMTLVFNWVHPKILTQLVVSILLFAWTAYTLADLLILQHKAVREAKKAKPANSPE